MRKTAEPEAPDEVALVADRTFILATRDTGYRDVSAAIAELIDNALQAEAGRVAVYVRDEYPDEQAPFVDGRPRVAGEVGPLCAVGSAAALDRGITIGVLDNGRGMSPETLRIALQFGGSERFGDRSGLGRFGMGLPNSSVSQARHLDVYSWRSPGAFRYTYLDVDAVVSGDLRSIPAPTTATLPAWAAADAGERGTLVVWARCDRLGRYRASTIAQRLHLPLGRIYRDALWRGLHLTINDALVAPVDPLYCRGPVPFAGALPYGDPLVYEFTAPVSGTRSQIEVRFAELPVMEWHAWGSSAKRRAGVVGGAGVSIVRAGREIDYGWHLMGGKRRENYDDWWRCEVRFWPELDELFGVTHNKQGIVPTAELRTALGPDLEGIARTLNARVRAAFETLKLKAASRLGAVAAASAQDRYLPPLRAGKCAIGADGLAYRINVAPLSGPEFYRAELLGKTVVVTLNRDHPFNTHLYEPACADPSGRERFGLECLVLAAARADLDDHSDGDGAGADHLRRGWADALAAFLSARGRS